MFLGETSLKDLDLEYSCCAHPFPDLKAASLRTRSHRRCGSSSEAARGEKARGLARTGERNEQARALAPMKDCSQDIRRRIHECER